ncbi:hypothetical protein HU200_005870 [Digitaria exilis]|uniref:Uncharacterized protein n=1 Tax=Digitaria exilis TaxID=1010633 RepID=A0A835FR81_9POAL|nr:hypothetical protein HU200_005870 [Digitaria exilis]
MDTSHFAPGLRLSPTMELVMSLCFIGFGTALHDFSKIYHSRRRPVVPVVGGHPKPLPGSQSHLMENRDSRPMLRMRCAQWLSADHVP